jgi:hypothetical protein
MSEQHPGLPPDWAQSRDPYDNPLWQPPGGPAGQPVNAPSVQSGGHHRAPKRQQLRNLLLAAGGVMIVLIALGVGVFVGKHSSGSNSGSAPSSSPPVASSSAADEATAAALPSGGQQYVSDMQTTFNFNSNVSDSAIASFGQQVCQARQSGTSVAGEVPTAEQSWSHTSPGDAIQMIVLAERDMCPSKERAQTVTYVVTGAQGASVNYGPAGTNLTGSVPMSVRAPLGTPSYYAINAQLQGAGEVKCKIEVDGVTISSATASGGYNIAGCEIGQNPVTNSWVNDNSG